METTTELHTLPIISTQHLTKKVSQHLLEAGNNNLWCPCASWEHGHFISLDDLEANSVEVPQCLIDIRNWLRTNNFPITQGSRRFTATWVRLDASADEQPGLPVYEW